MSNTSRRSFVKAIEQEEFDMDIMEALRLDAECLRKLGM
jgi:hypothetical protein